MKKIKCRISVEVQLGGKWHKGMHEEFIVLATDPLWIEILERFEIEQKPEEPKKISRTGI